MKLKKKSGLIGAIVALSCASLISVGFASWVITQDASEEVKGNIYVDTVQNNAHVMTVSPTSGAQINFTRPESPTATTYSWLSETTSNYEQLSASFTVTVTNVADAATGKAHLSASLVSGKISGDVFTQDETGQGYLGAVAANYVIALPVPTVADGSVTSNVYTTTVSFTLGWGTYFGSQNPYYFYNAHQANEEKSSGLTYAADADAALTALNTFLDGVSYKLTLSYAD